MTHDEAFLQDILEHPHDDTPRLIYADWLEDHGGEARAEFIRLQLLLTAHGGSDERDAAEMRGRAEQLLRDHDEDLAGPVIGELARGWEFHRGLVHAITIEAETLLRHADDLFRSAPIRHLRLLDARDHLRELVACPHLTQLTSLDLTANHVGDAGMRLLAMTGFLAPLTELVLRTNSLGPEAVRSLTGSRHLKRLRKLDLRWNKIGDPGAEALAGWHGLWQLDTLDLAGNGAWWWQQPLRDRLGRCVHF
jgi:uncharacterized protein (TIGR02996 family)